MWVYLSGYGPDSIARYLLHLGNYFLNEIAFDILYVEIFLEIGVGELVPTFISPILIRLLLYCVISEMDHPVCHVLEIEFLAGST